MSRGAVPFFSVIIPTFNRWPLVKDAVESALLQTVPDLEVIVVDDGSQDETVEQLRSCYGSAIRVLTQPNGGVSCARNVGVTEARGRYIAYLDSDDTWAPDKLATVQLAIEHYGADRCPFVFSDFDRFNLTERRAYPQTNTQLFPRLFRFFRQVGEEIYWADSSRALGCVVSDYPFFPSTFVIAKAVHDHVRWDTAVRYSEDFNLVGRIAERYPMLYIDRPLATVRMHDSNKSSNWTAKLDSHMQTLKVLDLRSAGDSARRAVIRRALGRRHFAAARSLGANHQFSRSIAHLLTAFRYPDWYLGAFQDLVREKVGLAPAALPAPEPSFQPERAAGDRPRWPLAPQGPARAARFQRARPDNVAQ